jgi:hypothetical protein
MNSRTLAAAAALLAACSLALVVTGCSQSGTLPAPTINGAAVEASAAAGTVRGITTTITVSQLVAKLNAAGLKTSRPGTTKKGLFLPAKYEPINVDTSFVQTYRFTSSEQAQGAAATVSTDGVTLAATPQQLVNVHWSGMPAYFRSGDMIVIFVSSKPPAKYLARDTRIFNALKATMGKPFAGTFLDSPGATSTATPF